MIAERILDSKRKAAKTAVNTTGGNATASIALNRLLVLGGASDDSSAISNVNDFPFFTSAVKSFYLDVVHALVSGKRWRTHHQHQTNRRVPTDPTPSSRRQ